MSSSRRLKLHTALNVPPHGNEDWSDPFAALQARMREGAAKRIHADVLEARRMGLIDEMGVRTSSELPEEMLPGAKREFGG